MDKTSKTGKERPFLLEIGHKVTDLMLPTCKYCGKKFIYKEGNKTWMIDRQNPLTHRPCRKVQPLPSCNCYEPVLHGDLKNLRSR